MDYIGLLRYCQFLSRLVNFKLYILQENFKVAVAIFFSCNQLTSIFSLFITAVIFANSELCKFS